MNTFQIAEPVLEGYINDIIPKERIDFLVAQAKEQIGEISKKKEIYDVFLAEVDAPKKVDTLILWVLFMSDEEICSQYIDAFDKDFEDEIPVSDLADLVFYIAYLEKVKKSQLDGFDYLDAYNEDGMQEVDQFAFTNGFLYIQKTKEVQIEF